jgi:hypothetical protein
MCKWAVSYSDYGNIYVDWYYSNDLEDAIRQYYKRHPASKYYITSRLLKVERV